MCFIAFDKSYFEWIIITNQYPRLHYVTLRSIFIVHPAITGKRLYNSYILTVIHCPFTNHWSVSQFSNVTLRSIFVNNGVTAAGNLHNSHILLTNHGCVKLKQVYCYSYFANLYFFIFLNKYWSFPKDYNRHIPLRQKYICSKRQYVT